MDKKEAIEVIRNNWPDSRYSMLREALDIAIAAIEESMVQKPATNSKYAVALEVYLEHLQDPYKSIRSSVFTSWLQTRLNSDKPNCS